MNLTDEGFDADIHQLLSHYDRLYFQGHLGATSVEWSDRMTLCAGICYLCRQGNSRYCKIRLSRPLLQYRPFSDTLSTLLHEMIHAYLWMRGSRGEVLDRDGHGSDFLCLAERINRSEVARGVRVTVFHGFHAEVHEARKHVWRCEGVCQTRAPHFGLVRRAMNRAPQPADRWWKDHQLSCGGQFTKISGPLDDSKPSKKPSPTIFDGRAGKGGETPLNHWRGVPRLARDESVPNMHQCPACRKHLAPNLTDLHDHLDECLLGTTTPIAARDTRSAKLCPVCEEFSTSDLEALDEHIETCLTLPSREYLLVEDRDTIPEIIDLT